LNSKNKRKLFNQNNFVLTHPKALTLPKSLTHPKSLTLPQVNDAPQVTDAPQVADALAKNNFFLAGLVLALVLRFEF
jgi:hypothetical protein